MAQIKIFMILYESISIRKQEEIDFSLVIKLEI